MPQPPDLRPYPAPPGYPQAPPSTSYLTLPTGWDSTWRAALAQSRWTPCWIMFNGASQTSGFGCSDALSKAYPQLLKNALVNQGYGVYGDFWPVSWNLDFNAGAFPGTPPFVVAPAPAHLWVAYGYTQAYYTAGGIAQGVTMATFTTPYACTAMDLLRQDYVAGNFQVSIDGEAPILLTDIGQSGVPIRYRRTGLANKVHTLVISGGTSTVTSCPIITGVCTYPGDPATTAGVGYARIYSPGASYSDTAIAGAPIDMCAQWMGNTAPTVPFNTGFGFPTQPHLIIAGELLENDMIFGRGVGIMQDAMRRKFNALRRGRKNASILHFPGYVPDNITSDIQGAIPNQGDWALYFNAAKQVAVDEYNAAMFNLNARWSQTPLTDGWLVSPSDAHWNDAGHADIASVINQLVVPS